MSLLAKLDNFDDLNDLAARLFFTLMTFIAWTIRPTGITWRTFMTLFTKLGDFNNLDDLLGF